MRKSLVQFINLDTRLDELTTPKQANVRCGDPWCGSQRPVAILYAYTINIDANFKKSRTQISPNATQLYHRVSDYKDKRLAKVLTCSNAMESQLHSPGWESQELCVACIHSS